MELFNELASQRHEQISFFYNPMFDLEVEDCIKKINELKSLYFPNKKTFTIRNA